jgi:hypothetical protein
VQRVVGGVEIEDDLLRRLSTGAEVSAEVGT